MKRIMLFLGLFFTAFSYSFAQNEIIIFGADTLKRDKIVPLNSNIRFDANNELTDEGYKAVEDIAQFMILNPYVRLEIRSHVNVGRQEGVEMSLARAKEIAGVLISKGIASYRVNATGYGNTIPSSKAGNDRIDFRILTIDKD